MIVLIESGTAGLVVSAVFLTEGEQDKKGEVTNRLRGRDGEGECG